MVRESYKERQVCGLKESNLKRLGFTAPPSTLTTKDKAGRRHFVTPTGSTFSLSIDNANNFKKRVEAAVHAFKDGGVDDELCRHLRNIDKCARNRRIGYKKKPVRSPASQSAGPSQPMS